MTGLSYEYILKHDNKEPHCADNNTTREVRLSYIEDIQYAQGYAEPGYQDPERGILFGNWNYFSRKAADLLEQAGYELEWSDEWSTCGQCGKAVRTSADCYDWQPYYTLVDGELDCFDCTDWESHLESIEDKPCSAVMQACNPADYGYALVSDSAEYESGLHEGMNDKPADILKRLHAAGHKRIVFRIPETSQFYIRFEAWEKIKEAE